MPKTIQVKREEAVLRREKNFTKYIEKAKEATVLKNPNKVKFWRERAALCRKEITAIREKLIQKYISPRPKS